MSPQLLDAIRTIVAFAVVLGVLVFVHELGHYLAARWRGVRVEAFSIGFGGPIAAWTDRNGTKWKLGWLPLGGFVKLHGQQAPGRAEGDTETPLFPGQTFFDKPLLSRAIIVGAGPVANFVLAILLFSILFAFIGRPYVLPEVAQVIPNSAAAHAGLQAGDRIISIAETKIVQFRDIQRIVLTHPDADIPVVIERGDRQMQLMVHLGSREEHGTRVGVLGIAGGATALQHLSPAQAIGAGFAETWQVSRDTIAALWQMLVGERGTEDLGGPLRIAQLSGQVAKLGLVNLVSFIAVLSVNLGLINLLPVPVLDGGYLLFYLAEAVLRRPIPPRALEFGLRAGLAVLVGLFVFATWNDLAHLGLFRWIAHLIG